MRILIVANHNTGSFSPFVVEQVNAIRQLGIDVDYYGIHGKGVFGYLSNLNALKKKIREYHPNLIHAHYGLSGLLANLQREIPVVTTYHGSDIHSRGLNLFLSRIAIRLSAYNIFVSEGLQILSGYRGKKQCVQPCGVDFKTFFPIEREEARKKLGWDADGKYILFASSFDNKVKNSPLAKATVSQIENGRLIELRGYNRDQVNWAINAANCMLMTSFREGSPQVVKEALACGTPIVSVNVGNVNDYCMGVEGCYITSYNIDDIVEKLHQALSFKGKTQGRTHILQKQLDNELIAKNIRSIYEKICKTY